jgi:hypothetical protein
VRDVDLRRSQLVVRGGKGDRDPVTVLPRACVGALARHLDRIRAQHERDVRRGAGWVELPFALARKSPAAGREWPWHWVFPATREYRDPETGQRRRHHLHETVLQDAVRDAVRRSGIAKRVTCHKQAARC